MLPQVHRRQRALYTPGSGAHAVRRTVDANCGRRTMAPALSNGHGCQARGVWRQPLPSKQPAERVDGGGRGLSFRCSSQILCTSKMLSTREVRVPLVESHAMETAQIVITEPNESCRGAVIADGDGNGVTGLGHRPPCPAVA